jgi:hypothetical protein
MTTDLAIIEYTINVENLVTLKKYQTLAKSIEGDKGDPGDTGATGADGPGVVFRGPWDSTVTYYDTDDYPTRRDAVLYNGTYYATLPNATTNLNKQPDTQTLFWESLGTDDYFVAAEIAIFKESFVQNTINVGTNTSGNANITIAGGTTSPYISIGQATKGYDQVGSWIGSDGTTGKLSLKSASNSLLWDGTNLTINGGGTFSGALSAATGTFTGALSGGTIQIGSGESVFKADSNGIYLGNETFANAEFRVTPAGALTSTSGTIGGWTIGATTLTNGNVTLDGAANNGALRIGVASYNSNGGIFIGNVPTTNPYRMSIKNSDGSKYFIWDGANLLIQAGNFSLDSGGTMSATNGNFAGNITSTATITGGTISGGSLTGGQIFIPSQAVPNFSVSTAGAVTASAGNIGGWTVSGGGISKDNLTLDSSVPAIELLDGTDVVVNIKGGDLSSLTAAAATITNGSPTGQTTYSDSTTVTNDTLIGLIQSPTPTLYTSNTYRFTTNASGDHVVTVNWGATSQILLSQANEQNGFEPLSYHFLNAELGFFVRQGSTSGTTIRTEVITTQNLAANPPANPFSSLLTYSLSGGSVTFTLSGLSSSTTYYIVPFVRSGQAGANAEGLTDLSLTISLKTPLITGLNAQQNVSKSEIVGGGLQVVNSTTAYLRAQRTVTDGVNTPWMVSNGYWQHDGELLFRYTPQGTNRYWRIYKGIVGGTDNQALIFDTDDNGGTGFGFLRSTQDVGAIDFTGQHRNVFKENKDIDITDNETIGKIVISTGNYKNLNTGSIESEPNINESLPIVEFSSKSNDKRVWGVISNTEDDDNDGNKVYSSGIFATVLTNVDKTENRYVINSLGEGGIWVCNQNGSFENGDYITTSDIEGLGMKQDDDLLHNYTVAKITQDCDFTDDEKYIEIEHSGSLYRKQFVGCTYHCG